MQNFEYDRVVLHAVSVVKKSYSQTNQALNKSLGTLPYKVALHTQERRFPNFLYRFLYTLQKKQQHVTLIL